MTRIQMMLQLLQTDGINSKQQVIKILQEMHDKEPITVDEIVEISHSAAKEKGWWDHEKTEAELLCLFHSEVSEALEEVRNGHLPNETYYSGKQVIKSATYDSDKSSITTVITSAIKGEAIFVSNEYIEANKPEGIPSELADIIIRIGDFCGYYGIDLDAAIREKLEYNKSRSYRHGNKVL